MRTRILWLIASTVVVSLFAAVQMGGPVDADKCCVSTSCGGTYACSALTDECRATVAFGKCKANNDVADDCTPSSSTCARKYYQTWPSVCPNGPSDMCGDIVGLGDRCS
jgi:hypothetical protein